MEDLLTKAKQLKKEANVPDDFKRAADMYSAVWTPDSDKWIGWEYVFCMRKSKQFNIDKAIEISQSIYEIDPSFKINNDQYAWLLNEKYFKVAKESYTPEETISLLETIALMAQLSPHAEKSPLEFCCFRLFNYAKKLKLSLSAKKTLEILECLNPDLISVEPYEVELKGKTKEIQSRKEAYYSIKTKALLNEKLYEECIACCDEAFEKIENFHHDNDKWIEDRRIKCLAELGSDIDSAITKLKELVVKKDSWFLLYSLGALYQKKQDQSNALLYFCRAALTKDPPKMKVKLMIEIGDCLTDSLIAQTHYYFVKQIREEEGWSMPYTLQQKTTNDNHEKIKYHELQNVWRDIIYSKMIVYTGEISSLAQSGKTGFIKYNNTSIFFRISNVFSRSQLFYKSKVKFVITDSFDKSKDCLSIEANYITVIP